MSAPAAAPAPGPAAAAANLVTVPDGDDPPLRKPCNYPKSAQHTQEIFDLATGRLGRKLAGMEKKRDFVQYEENLGMHPTRHRRYRNASVGFCVGEAKPAEERCGPCRDGHGSFP